MRPRKPKTPTLEEMGGVRLEPVGSHDTDPFIDQDVIGIESAPYKDPSSLGYEGSLGITSGSTGVFHYPTSTSRSDLFLPNEGNPWAYAQPALDPILCSFCGTPALPEKERIELYGAEYGLCFACGGNLPATNRKRVESGKVLAEYTTVSYPELVAMRMETSLPRWMLSVIISSVVILVIIILNMVR